MKNRKQLIEQFLIPIGLFLVAFIWKYFHVGARDICLDEPFTIFHAQDSLINILKLPSQNEPTPPLFMLLLHFWIKLFGISAQSVRFLPILFNALTVVIIYLIGKRFFNIWSGITASALFIFSTLHFFFGADTRTYSMLSFATASSLYYILSIQRNPENRKFIIGLIVSNLILIYGHYFGLLVIFMQLLVAILFLNKKNVFRKIFTGLVITGVLYIPMISILIKQFFVSKKGTWLSPPKSVDYIHELQWFLNSENSFKMMYFILGAGLILAIFSKIKKEQVRDIFILFIWWFIPYSLMFIASYKIPMFTNRYILFNSIGFYLFIAVAISYFYQKIKFTGPIISIALIVVTYMHMFTRDFAPRKLKETTTFIKTQMNDSTSIIIYPYWADLGFVYHYNKAIFKSVDDYSEKLTANNIYRTWGVDDTKSFIENTRPSRVILYQDNTPSIDPPNILFNYIDSIYTRTDSVLFDGGLVVTIFKAQEAAISLK
jgi:uncharacterized membrane protein